MDTSPNGVIDVVVVGGGQAALAAGYYLRRAGAGFVILDDQSGPGGAWRHGWDSLRLFSPAEYSRLPGWPMPPEPGEVFPSAAHCRNYLAEYERRYDLPVHRPVHVDAVRPAGELFEVVTGAGIWHARSVISATGTWRHPHWPGYPGHDRFGGTQLHTVSYRRPEAYAGQHVVVVGGGNSAAQILADISQVAETTWVAPRTPRFLPGDVDGRALFDIATRRELALRESAAQRESAAHNGEGRAGALPELGDIVMVPSVQDARRRGVLQARPMFSRLTPGGVAWPDGSTLECDAIIWCTGFRPALSHLAPLRLPLTVDGVPRTEGARSVDAPGLHLFGYGDWTGWASATLIGAGRTARAYVPAVIGSRTPQA